ncbi:hypothetical protein [Sinomonas cyclohexanicum]|nr:hypothetical protein [Corynebacterium cyclohexanicum]
MDPAHATPGHPAAPKTVHAAGSDASRSAARRGLAAERRSAPGA